MKSTQKNMLRGEFPYCPIHNLPMVSEGNGHFSCIDKKCDYHFIYQSKMDDDGVHISMESSFGINIPPTIFDETLKQNNK